MDSDKRELLDQFINVTGVDNERAKFYLESAAWDLQVALASFYEEDGDDDIQEIAASVGRERSQPQVEPKVVNPQPSPLPLPQQSNKQTSKYATIFGVKNEQESDEEEGQAFYAGGSDRSGQQILGPKKKSKNDFVGDMFKAAKDLGAEVVDTESRENTSGKKSSSFQGAGYRLGDNDDDDIEIISASTSRPSPMAKVKKDVTLKMWKNGFSINDGVEQRSYDDPANKDFLESIRRGEIPVELIREARGGEVSLTMENHQNEMFDPPSMLNVRAFSGKGHMLGSPVPPSLTAAPAQSNQQSTNTTTPEIIKLDDSQPVTTIQIRLADGSRLVTKFNHSHTIGDLRQYITTARSQFEAVEFTLMTTFPNRELMDDKRTLKDENLLNAVVMQKIV